MQSLLALVLLSVPFQQAGGADAKPKPDRSGEFELKRVMDATAAMRNVRFHLATSTRDTKDGAWYVDSDMDVWYAEPGKFRLHASDMWGGGLLIVCDGKTLLKDQESDWAPITLQLAPKTLIEADNDLTWDGGRSSPLYYLLDGSAALDKLASKDEDVRVLPAEGGVSRLQFHHKTAGTVTLYYRDENGKPVFTRFEYDKLAYLKSMHKQFPDWYDEPAEPMTRQTVWMEKAPADGSLYDATPPKGREVTDSRKQPAKKPPQVR